MRRTILLTALVAVIAASAALAKSSFPQTIALPNGWQPEGIAVGDGNTFYVGSIPTGAVYRGDLRSGKGATFVPGATGRAAIGVEHDRGRLFVAGGPTGKAFVYNARTGALCGSCSSRPAAARRSSTTSSSPSAPRTSPIRTRRCSTASRSRRTAHPPRPPRALPLTGDFQLVGGFNLNGIDATPDGKTLVVVQSATGKLFRVVAATGVTKADRPRRRRGDRTATACCSTGGRSTSSRTS